jgi:hypothetical protein
VSFSSDPPLFDWINYVSCRSLWPRGLRCRSLTCWDCGFQSHPLAWMSFCCECCVLSGTGLFDGPITRIEDSYRLWCLFMWSRNLLNESALAHWVLWRQNTKKSYIEKISNCGQFLFALPINPTSNWFSLFLINAFEITVTNFVLFTGSDICVDIHFMKLHKKRFVVIFVLIWSYIWPIRAKINFGLLSILISRLLTKNLIEIHLVVLGTQCRNINHPCRCIQSPLHY